MTDTKLYSANPSLFQRAPAHLRDAFTRSYLSAKAKLTPEEARLLQRLRDERTGCEISQLADHIEQRGISPDDPDHDLLTRIVQWDQNPEPANWRALLTYYNARLYRQEDQRDLVENPQPQTDAKIAALAAAIDAEPALVDGAPSALVAIIMIWRDMATAAKNNDSEAALIALRHWLDLNRVIRGFDDHVTLDDLAVGDWHELDSNDEREECAKALAEIIVNNARAIRAETTNEHLEDTLPNV